MERRKFIVGLGALSAGSTAAMGTGAFTSVEAKRDARVQVSDDSKALLGLASCDSPNGHYVTEDNGYKGKEVAIEISEENATPGGGEGVNDEAYTTILDMLQIRNQGTQTVKVWITVYDDDGNSASAPDNYVTFVDSNGDPMMSDGNAIKLGVGEAECAGLEIDTHGDCHGCELFEEYDHFVVHAEAV